MNNFLYDSLKIHSCGITACWAEWSWDTGRHPIGDYDLWTVLKGKGTLTADGAVYPVSSGSCFLLRPGPRYVGAQDPQDRLTVLHIHFDFLDERGELLRFAEGEGISLMRRLIDFDFVQRLLYRVLDAVSAGEERAAVHWLLAALDEIVRQDRQKPRANPLYREISALCQQIQRAPGEEWKLHRQADRFGYSADYFGRLFAQVAGSPFSAYVIGVRMNQAKLLLRSSNLPVGEIAAQLGYREIYFFSKQFHNWTGFTPSGYRKAAFLPE